MGVTCSKQSLRDEYNDDMIMMMGGNIHSDDDGVNEGSKPWGRWWRMKKHKKYRRRHSAHKKQAASPDPVIKELMLRSCECIHRREQLMEEQLLSEQMQQVQTKTTENVGYSDNLATEPAVSKNPETVCTANVVTAAPTNATNASAYAGQYHLLFKHQQKLVAHWHSENEQRDSGHGHSRESAAARKPALLSTTQISCDKIPPLTEWGRQQQPEAWTAWEQQQSPSNDVDDGADDFQQQQQQQQKQKAYTSLPTHLVIRRRAVRSYEEGLSGTHIYAMRYPADHNSLGLEDKCNRDHIIAQEQCPGAKAKKQKKGKYGKHSSTSTTTATYTPATPVGASTASAPYSGARSSSHRIDTSNSANCPITVLPSAALTVPPPPRRVLPSPTSVAAATMFSEDISSIENKILVDHLFNPDTMRAPPLQRVVDWATVSEEHNIYIADTGLHSTACDEMVLESEYECRGQYTAYTYAKQTLGCREFPPLAQMCQPAVHTVMSAIIELSSDRSRPATYNTNLALDDREPHMVKYDLTKKDRQKLEMHTDKSEWTFLIALSNGCGLDYEGGGTYFECLDATVHLQRGHALIFPGKLRHCGQRITSGLRFLLVGFLVDKSPAEDAPSNNTDTGNNNSSSPQEINAVAATDQN